MAVQGLGFGFRAKGLKLTDSGLKSLFQQAVILSPQSKKSLNRPNTSLPVLEYWDYVLLGGAGLVREGITVSFMRLHVCLGGLYIALLNLNPQPVNLLVHPYMGISQN